jgi:putative membrane protein
MIVKTQFTPASMWPYARFELGLAAISSVAAWALVSRFGVHQVALPATLATVLGTALSILLAVRVNTAYQRWWEASGCWAQILGASRTLVRVAVAVTNAKHQPTEAAQAFQQDVARRQVAYLTALRLQLRRQLDTPEGRAELASHLSAEENAALAGADNPAMLLLERQSARIFDAFGEGLLAGFDNFQMEVALAAISIQQALAERIAMQPTPRTYNVFSRYLVHIYVVVFPFAVIGALTRDHWLVIPATLVIGYAFRMIERIGAVVEAPFAAVVHDVPLTAITTTAQRDLAELVGHGHRPPAPHPVAGYLW